MVMLGDDPPKPATVLVYKSEDDGALYLPEWIDADPETGEARGYVRYEIPETVTLTAAQCCGHYGEITELLVASNQLTKVEPQ